MKFDFDGDRKADVAWVDTDGRWFRAGESTPFYSGGNHLFNGVGFFPDHADGDIPVPGDYDGDDRWEPAVVRNQSAWMTDGAAGTLTFPAPPETGTQTGTRMPVIVPVPADYNGDGRTDPAWYRETDATWWISGEAAPIAFGRPYNDHTDADYDVPVPGDYDGDGRDEVATFDPSSGDFTIRGQPVPVSTGPLAGMPAPADYDGDGDDDAAELHNTGVEEGVPIYLPPGSSMINPAVPGATYFIHGQASVQPFSGSRRFSQTALPVPADYRGVGRAQAAGVSLQGGEYGTWEIDGAVIAQQNTGRSVMPAWLWLSQYRLDFMLRCHYGPQADSC